MTTARKMMIGLAVIFGLYGAATLVVRHDWRDGLWSLAVCFALVLGVVPWPLKSKASQAVADRQSQLKLR